MIVWIPKKPEIELMLTRMADKVKGAKEISDIEEWLCDELCKLDCHISNRAGIERGDIAEHARSAAIFAQPKESND